MSVQPWWGVEHIRLCAIRALYVHVPLIVGSVEWAINPFQPPLPNPVTSVDALGRPLNGGYYMHEAQPGDTERPVPHIEIQTVGDPIETDVTDAEASLWQWEIEARVRIGYRSGTLGIARDQAIALASACRIAMAQYTIDVARQLDPGESFGICWAEEGRPPELRNTSLAPVQDGQQVSIIDATASVLYVQRRYNPAGWRGNPVTPPIPTP